MAIKLGTAINDNFDNSQMTLNSRLASANNGNDDFFSGDLNKLKSLVSGLNIVTKSADFTVQPTDTGTVFLCENTLTVTLQGLGAYSSDFWIGIKHYSNSTSDIITIATPDQIEYYSQLVLSRNQGVIIFPSGGNWGALNTADDGATFMNVFNIGTDAATIGSQHNRGLVRLSTSGTAKTVTLPTNASDPMPVGSTVVIYNPSTTASATISGGTIEGVTTIGPQQTVVVTKRVFGTPNAWLVNIFGNTGAFALTLAANLSTYSLLDLSSSSIARTTLGLKKSYVQATISSSASLFSAATFISLTATGAGTTYIMPPANTAVEAGVSYVTGTLTFVNNTGNFAINLLYNDGTTPLFTLPAGTCAILTLSNNGSANGVYSYQLIPGYSPFVNTQSGTTYTLTLDDANSVIETTASGGNCTITIPTNASVPITIGASTKVINQQGSTRLTTISLAGGVTLVGNTPNVGNNGFFVLQKIGTNTWEVVQDYESQTLSVTFTFGGANSGAQTVKLIKNMGQVTVQVPSFNITNSIPFTSSISGGTALPSRFTPAQSQAISAITILDSANVPCAFRIDNGGNIIYNQQDASDFSATDVISISKTMNYLL